MFVFSFFTTVVLDGGEPRTPQTSPGGMQSATPATTPVGVDDLSEALSAALGAGDARRRQPGGSDAADNGPYDASMQDAMRSMAPQAMVASMEGRALPRTTSERTGTFVRCPQCGVAGFVLHVSHPNGAPRRSANRCHE